MSVSSQINPAGGGLLDAGDELSQGGLAAAVGAGDHRQFAVRGGETQIVQYLVPSGVFQLMCSSRSIWHLLLAFLFVSLYHAGKGSYNPIMLFFTADGFEKSQWTMRGRSAERIPKNKTTRLDNGPRLCHNKEIVGSIFASVSVAQQDRAFAS